MNKLILKFQIAILTLFGFLTIKAQGLDIDVDLDGKDSPAIFEKPGFWVAVAIVVIIIAIILRKK